MWSWPHALSRRLKTRDTHLSTCRPTSDRPLSSAHSIPAPAEGSAALLSTFRVLSTKAIAKRVPAASFTPWERSAIYSGRKKRVSWRDSEWVKVVVLTTHECWKPIAWESFEMTCGAALNPRIHLLRRSLPSIWVQSCCNLMCDFLCLQFTYIKVCRKSGMNNEVKSFLNFLWNWHFPLLYQRSIHEQSLNTVISGNQYPSSPYMTRTWNGKQYQYNGMLHHFKILNEDISYNHIR